MSDELRAVSIRDTKSASDDEWSPFKRNSKLNVTFYSDPWWKRLRARVLRQPLWHRIEKDGA